MIDEIRNWFSPEGRISRKDYWLQVILPVALMFLSLPAFNMFGWVFKGALRNAFVVAMMFFPVIVGALLVYSQRLSALVIRRHHDLGKKGGRYIRSPGVNLLVMLAATPLLMVGFVFFYLLLIAALMTLSQNGGLILFVAAVILPFVGFALWRHYQLAFLPGMSGDNEYGPDPLDRPPLGGAPTPPAPTAPMIVRVAPQPARPGPAGATFGRKR